MVVKVSIESVVTNQENRETRIVLLSDSGGRGLNLSLVPYTGDLEAAFRKKRCPFSYKLMVTILNTTGIEIENLRIEKVEQGVIRGVLTVRNGNAIHQVIVRPDEAVILMACFADKPIYVEDALLEDRSIHENVRGSKMAAPHPGKAEG